MIGIKDFGMPRCCVNCQMCDAYEKGTCVITETECEDMYSQRNGDCPLVEITEPSEQIIWERDTAIQQLKDLGYGLGEKPKTGHWILDETDNSITCNKCGCLMWASDLCHGDAHYCPNCGARMESEDRE